MRATSKWQTKLRERWVHSLSELKELSDLQITGSVWYSNRLCHGDRLMRMDRVEFFMWSSFDNSYPCLLL
jgi:hypothetical protein